jgi:hypothetical protein
VALIASKSAVQLLASAGIFLVIGLMIFKLACWLAVGGAFS